MMTATEARFQDDLKTGRHADAVPRETYACPVCKDAGWLRYDVLPDHPKFGEIVECACGLVQRRRIERMNRAARGEQ